MPWLSWIVSNMFLALLLGTGGRGSCRLAAHDRSHPLGWHSGIWHLIGAGTLALALLA